MNEMLSKQKIFQNVQKDTTVVNESSKVAGYTVNIQKPTAVLYIRHESENEVVLGGGGACL